MLAIVFFALPKFSYVFQLSIHMDMNVSTQKLISIHRSMLCTCTYIFIGYNFVLPLNDLHACVNVA